MDARATSVLATVHPDLRRVMLAAAQTPQPFEPYYGIRTLEAEEQAVASGHSQTLHSRHLACARYGGVAMAVDVGAWINGQFSFATGEQREVFGLIAKQVLAAADVAGVKVQWGGADVGAWTDGVPSSFHDWGHFQLDPSEYPA